MNWIEYVRKRSWPNLECYPEIWIESLRKLRLPSFRLLSKNLKTRIYKTLTLPVVLYGCETWSITLREIVDWIGWIFGPKRDEVTSEWTNLHNEELRNLYSSPSIIRINKSKRMRWAGHITGMGENRNAYEVLMGKLKGKRPLERPR
jgi:hypothetical protein